MQILGIVLIILVIGLLIYYFFWSKREEKTTETAAQQKVTVIVKGAYSPNIIRAKVDKPLVIEFDRQENNDCSKKVIISDFNISEELPDFGKGEIKILPKKTGEFPFSCEMGMYQGKIIVE